MGRGKGQSKKVSDSWRGGGSVGLGAEAAREVRRQSLCLLILQFSDEDADSGNNYYKYLDQAS